MSIVYVQFSAADSTKVVAIFGCAQDSDDYPFQAQVEDTDPRYQAFLNPVLVPPSVSRFQARSALDDAGEFDAIDALMARAETPLRMRRAWADAQVFERDSETVEAMRIARGWTPEQVDALFIAADKIKA